MRISIVLEALTGSFITDMDRVAKEAKKRAEETRQAWVDGAKALGVSLGASASAAAAALGLIAQNAVKMADKIDEASQRTGVAAESLSRLKYAAEQSGSSLESVEKALQKLSREADSGGENLARIGVSATDMAGKMRPAEELLLEVADRMQNLGTASERSAAAQAVFGKAGAELIPLLSQGSKAIKEMGDEAARLGVVVSGDTAAAAAAFNDNLDKLQSAATGLGLTLAEELLPHLVEITQAAVDFAQGLREDGTLAAWIEGIKEASGYVDELAVFISTRLVTGALVSLTPALLSAAGGMSAAAAATAVFKGALAALGGPVGLLLTGVAAAAVAIYDYESASDRAAEANASLVKAVDLLKEAQGNGIRPAIMAAEAQRDAAEAALEAAKADLDAAKAKAALLQVTAQELRVRPGAGLGPSGNVGGFISAQEVTALVARIEELQGTIGSANTVITDGNKRLAEWEARLKALRDGAGRLAPTLKDQAKAAKDAADAFKLASDEAERFDEWNRKVADGAQDARENLQGMADDLAADIGGPAVMAWQDLQRTLADVEAELARIRMEGPATGEDLALAAKIGEDAWRRYELAMKEINERASEDAKRAAEESARAWEDFAYGMADAVLDGSDGVKRYFKRLLDDLKRELIASGLMALFRGIFNVGGGAGGGAGSLLGAMFNGGGAGGGNLLGGLMGGLQGAGGNGLVGSVLGAVGSWLGIGAGAAGPSLMAGLSAMPGAAGFAGVGAGAATSAGLLSGSGLSTAFAGVPIIGWIAAAAAMNQSLFAQGWRAGGGSLTLPDGQQVRGGSGSNALGNILTAGAVTGLDRALRGLGLSDSVASLLSGSSIHARLFGRKAPELTGQTTTYNLGADGVSGSNLYRILERGGVFRSDRRSTRTGALSDDAADAAQALFDSVRQVMIDSANALEGEAPEMIASALRVVQEFDKKGKVKSTKYFVDILGRTWEEATEEAATQRIAAEAMIATIDAILGTTVEAASQSAASAAGEVVNNAAAGAAGALGSVGDMLVKTMAGAQGEASAIAERWRDDAATLADGAQMLLAAAVDIRAGAGLLGDDGTLTQIADLVEELQAPGEALAATYQRVTASAALFDEALALSGVSIDRTREELVRFAVDIADAAGGLDRAQALWSAYFQNFFTEAERAEYARRQAEGRASSQLGDIGLDLTQFSGAGGMQAFRDLFEGQMATLSAEAYVEWLEAAEALAAFVRLSGEASGAVTAVGGSLAELMGTIKEELGAFAPPPSFAQQLQAIGLEIDALIQRATELGASEQDLATIRQLGAARVNAVLEEQAAAYANYADIVRGVTDDLADARGLTDFQREMREIDRWLAQTTAAMNEAARAAGMQGAAEADLAAAHELAAIRAAAAIARLQERGRDVVAELYGSPLEQLEQQIAAIESGIGGFAGGVAGGMEQVQQATEAAVNAQIGAQQRIRDWLDNLLGTDLGGLRPRDQLRETQALFDRTLTAALGGDAEAMGELPALADQLLRLGQRVYASGGGFFDLRDMIRDALEQVAALPSVTPEPGSGQAGGGGGAGGGPNMWAGGGGMDLEALYTERERLLAQQAAEERRQLATELMGIVRDLVIATGEPLEGIAEQLGFSMADLISDLGVNLDDLTVATAVQLADIAQAMGVELTDLAGSVGISLGSLADRQSLLNDALEAEISGLPQGQRDLLEPLLRDVEEAAALGDTAGVEAGIDAMEDAIAEMAPELRDQLAPFFLGIRPADPATELAHLATMETTLGSSLSELQAQTLSLANIEGLLNGGGGLPTQASGPLEPGGGFGGGNGVPPPPAVAEFLKREGIPVTPAGEGPTRGTDALVAELRELRRERLAADEYTRGLERRLAQIETTTKAASDAQVRAMERQTDAIRGR